MFEGIDAGALVAELERERRRSACGSAASERYIAADEAGLYRDALGAVPPGGLPDAFLADVPDALRGAVRPLRPHPRPVHRPRSCATATASTPQRVLRELERDGELVRGELRPGGSEREWCDVEVLRRLRRASLAVLRKEIEPADQSRLAGFLPSWQGVDRHAGAGAGVDRLREVLVPLQGLALPAEIWERDVLPRRTGAYSQSWMDSLCASGELVWVGAGPLARSGRVALYFREDAPAIGAPDLRCAGRRPRPASEHELLRARLRRGPCFFVDLLAEVDAARGGPAGGAVGSGVGRRGDQRRLGSPARPAARARAQARAPRPLAGRRAPPRRAARALPGAGAAARSRRSRGAGR